MFETAFMRTALLASIAASVPLSLLGVYLIIRRIVFLGLVLANAATVGAALAQVMDWPPEVSAVVMAILTALCLGALPIPRQVSAQSIIGWAYAAAASITVLILAGATRADADVLHLLYGNVLAVSRRHAIGLAGVAIAIGVLHALFRSRFLLVTFDAEAAQVAGGRTRLWSVGLNLSIGVAAAAAVHEVGALLAFSLLTLPPMASLLVARRIQTVFAGSLMIGLAAVCLGLIAAFEFDLPPGPVSVALLALNVPVMGAVSHWRE